MKIAYDIRCLISKQSGIGNYLKELLYSINQFTKEIEFIFFSSSLKESINPELFKSFKDYSLTQLKIPVKILDYLWNKYQWPYIETLTRKNPDISHSPTPVPLPSKSKKIITIHDLCFLDSPEFVMPQIQQYYSRYFKRYVDSADAYIFNSNFTKKRFFKYFPHAEKKKNKVIYLNSPIDKSQEIKPKDFNLKDDFILHIGTIEPRKNISNLLDAMEIVRKKCDTKLILAGSLGWETEEVKERIALMNKEKKIFYFGYLKDQEINYLYKKAKAVIFPSHYEGFGLPIMEAAREQKIVLASRLPVFEELYKDYPIYFDKNNPNDIAEKIINLDQNTELFKEKALQSKIISEKFSSHKVASQHLDFYKELS